MNRHLTIKLYHFIFIALFSLNIFSNSGGPLSPEQAAYDVKYYELDLRIDPSSKTINGSLLVTAEIFDDVNSFVLDLVDRFTVDSVLIGSHSSNFVNVNFEHVSGQILIEPGGTLTTGEIITAKIYYGGTPRVSNNPPWDDGFVWKNADGYPWVGVACETGGADIWWPCKDHPSDEPDSMRMSFTVPDPLFCASNGKYEGSIENDDETTTYNWFVSTPINNYNVSIYIADYQLIEDEYESVSGEQIPFYFWVLPSSYNKAVAYMDVFLEEFNFLESVFGAFPFPEDKHGWAHAPYWGMEHQTIIAYGHNFTKNNWGYDYIHYHELAHEWWGNLITAKDWSDVWIHEGLATYSEALYVEHLSGKRKYLDFMAARQPNNNHNYRLAPRSEMTAEEAFDRLNSYYRGASVLHTLRFHLGDEQFFSLLKQWTYPDTTDYNNINGRQCRIHSTEDMKNEAERITGLELGPFFEVFFREVKYPVLHVDRNEHQTFFEWSTETGVKLDLSVPIRINGNNYLVEMTDGKGSFEVSLDDYIYIDPDDWILMASPKITSVNDDEINLEFTLEQNYPNPFNPETKIVYSIPNREHVKIAVYDNLGTEIKTLMNQVQSPGQYEISFDGENLSSGVYYYRIITGSYQETKKMILLR